MRVLMITSIILISATQSFSQNFGIGTDNPDPQAIMDIVSTSKGVLIPRMTTTQRNSIGVVNGQDDGLMIYNLTTDEFNYWDGSQWLSFPSAGSDDDWTRGSGVMYPSNLGDNVGIGINNPVDRLVVAGGRVEFTNTTDANGTAGSGVLEIANGLRLDGNEIITNTNSPIFINGDNNGDIGMDGSTFRIDASENNVGIGITTPLHKLDVFHNSSITDAHMRLYENGTDYARLSFSNSTYSNKFWTIAGLVNVTDVTSQLNFYFNNGITAGDKMQIHGNGRVSINGGIPNARLDINETGVVDNILELPGGRTMIWDASNNSNRYGFNVGDFSPDALYMFSSEGNWQQAMVWADGDGDPNETIFGISSRPTGGTWNSRFIIDQEGDVGIGTNFPAYDLQLGANSAAKPGGGSWTNFSDKSLKKDIKPYKEGLNEVLQLNPIWYTYNGRFGIPQEEYVGTIAQELQEVFPHMVEKAELQDEEGNLEKVLTVNYSALDFALVNSVKELHEIIVKLNKTNNQQQAEIDFLKAKMKELLE